MAERAYVRTPDMPDAVRPFTGTEYAELWQGDETTGKMVKVPYNELQGNPIAHQLSHKLNGSDQLGNNNPAPNIHPISDSSGKLDTWISDASTTVKGKVQLATDGESSALKATASNDGRLINARAPTLHGSTHNIGGGDEISGLPSAGEKAAMAGSYGTPSDSNRYVTETDPAFAAISPVINTSVTYTVGTGGDYATLNSAIENVSLKYPQYKLSGVRVTLQLLTGFVMQEQLIVDGKDLGWITITAVDATTTVDPAYITVSADGTYAVFAGINHATLPKISAVFAFASYQAIVGIYLKNGSSIVVDAGGFNYAAMGINCRRVSNASVRDSSFQYCGHGVYADENSHIAVWDCNVSNYVTAGFYAKFNSVIDVPSYTCTTSGGNGIVEVIAGGIVYINAPETSCSQQQNVLLPKGTIQNVSLPSLACRARASFDGATAANVSGTYNIPGTTVCTVTLASHGFMAGNRVYLDFTSGTATDGLYTIQTVTTDTFTVTTNVLTTSGNVTLTRRLILGSANAHSISYIGTGLYWLNFIFPMSDATFSVSLSCENEGVGPFVNTNNTAYPKTLYGVSIECTNVSGADFNGKLIEISVFD